ncbi:MAG: hypothetical protein K940chlam8_00214 [Chlamydiae bacterium]|nr:hypothetical protein [Chlamydiota bacterium]
MPVATQATYTTYNNATQTLKAFQGPKVVPDLSKATFYACATLKEKPLVFLKYYLLQFMHFLIESVHVFTQGREQAFCQHTITANNFLAQIETINRVKTVIAAYFGQLATNDKGEDFDAILMADKYVAKITADEIDLAQQELGKILTDLDGTPFAAFKILIQELKATSEWLFWHETLELPVPLASIKSFLDGQDPSENLTKWCQALETLVGQGKLDVFKLHKFLLVILKRLGREERELKRLAQLIQLHAPSVIALTSEDYRTELQTHFVEDIVITDGDNTIQQEGTTLTFNSKNPLIIFTTSSEAACEYFPQVTHENFALGIVTIGKIEGERLTDETALIQFLKTEQATPHWFEGLKPEMVIQSPAGIRFTCAPNILREFPLESVSDFVRLAFEDPISALIDLGFTSEHPRVTAYLSVVENLELPMADLVLEAFRTSVRNLFENVSSELKKKYVLPKKSISLDSFLSQWMEENACYHRAPELSAFCTFIAQNFKNLELKNVSGIQLLEDETLPNFSIRMNALGMFKITQIRQLFSKLQPKH